MRDSVAARVMGGSPVAVLIRLLFVSLLVGALMSWLQIDLADIVAAVEHGFVRIWGTGFEAVDRIGRTLLAGAAVVVPVWVVMRGLSYRGRAPVAGPRAPSRWGDPGRVGDEPRP